MTCSVGGKEMKVGGGGGGGVLMFVSVILALLEIQINERSY